MSGALVGLTEGVSGALVGLTEGVTLDSGWGVEVTGEMVVVGGSNGIDTSMGETDVGLSSGHGDTGRWTALAFSSLRVRFCQKASSASRAAVL